MQLYKLYSNNGKCLWDNLSLEWCIANVNLAFQGSDCRQKRCPKDCSNNGDCFEGKCYCRPGWCGSGCSEKCAANRMIDVLDSMPRNPAGKTSKTMFASIEKTVMKDLVEAEVDTRKQLQTEKKNGVGEGRGQG